MSAILWVQAWVLVGGWLAAGAVYVVTRDTARALDVGYKWSLTALLIGAMGFLVMLALR